MNPSNFKSKPMNSVKQKSETETIARNIMVILSRTGDEWREVSWDEYKAERLKDGEFSEWAERPHFEAAIPYTTSEANARRFSPVWDSVQIEQL